MDRTTRQTTPLQRMRSEGKLFGHVSSSSVSSLGKGSFDPPKTPTVDDDDSDSSDDTNASVCVAGDSFLDYESDDTTRGRTKGSAESFRRSSVSIHSSRRSSVSDMTPEMFPESSFAALGGLGGIGGNGLFSRSRRPSLLTPSKERDSMSFSRDLGPPTAPSLGSPALSALSNDSDAASPTPPPPRLVTQTRKSMKPKPKSFLRITRDLQEEGAPLDSEMRHEAAITCALREDESEHQQNQHHQKNKSPELVPSAWASRSAGLPPVDTTAQDECFRFDEEVQSDADWMAAHHQPPVMDDSKQQKRKAAIMQDSFEPSVLKRRAVSPGLSSPILSGSPSSVGAMRNKQVQDTSDEMHKLSIL